MERRSAAKRLSLGLLTACAIACSGAAFAQSEPPSAARMDAAKERFRRGVALSDQAEAKHDLALYEAALVEYKQAYAIWPKDSILWNMSICELETKRYLDALRHFKEYEKNAKPNQPDREELKKYLTTLRALTARVKVIANPGSHVLLDKNDVATAPVEDAIDVLPGRHTLESDGHTVIVVVAAGDETRVTLADETAVPSAPSVVASDSIHRDTPAREGYWTTPRVVGAALLGAGVASMVTGFAFGRLSAGARSDAEAIQLGSSACFGPSPALACADYALHRSDQDSDHTLSIAFWAVGGAATVVGAALLIPWRSSKSSVALAPIMTPHEAGLSVRGVLW